MRYFLLLAVFGLVLGSCTINRNIMFKTDHDYEFDVPSDSANVIQVLSPNDRILFRLFSNEGARLIELTAGVNEGNNVNAILPNFTFIIQPDGFVELPEVGLVEVAGLTVIEAQNKIEGLYSVYYKRPYAMIELVNNRVAVFPGSGGQAKMVTLDQPNLTVIDVLGLAGGIADRGDARKVKLIRRPDGGRNEVYLMDLSTIEGIKFANMIVQDRDVIYVEPVPEVASEVLKDISPFVSIISGVALIYAIINGTL